MAESRTVRHVPAARRDRPRVAMVVDHPERDLPGLVLVALDLARRGVACHLVPLNLQEREIWALAPDFVLFNYLRPSNERFARDLRTAGIAFGVLDTEGAIWPDHEEYASLLWTDAGLRRAARCVCMWGAPLASYLVSHGLFAREQITVTGCPRFDLYAEPWRHLREDAAEALRHPARRVLINTNFSISNPRFTTAEKSVALHHTVLGYAPAELRRIVDDEAAAMRETMTMAVRLAEAFPALQVVMRPHPFEDPAPYETVAAAVARGGRGWLEVRQDESIQAAIFSACAVVQRSCTTAIEAGLAGVPTFSPQWMPAPFLMPAAEAASVPCESFDDLRAHLEAVVGGAYRLPDATRRALAETVRDCCFAADGFSHRRASDAVLRVVAPLLRHPAPIDARLCRQHLYRAGVASPLAAGVDEGGMARVARVVRRTLRLSPEWSFTRMREVPALGWLEGRKRFDAAQVQALATRARQLGTFASEDVMEIDVRPAAHGAGGARTPARYGVTIAPRDWFASASRVRARKGLADGASVVAPI